MRRAFDLFLGALFLPVGLFFDWRADRHKRRMFRKRYGRDLYEGEGGIMKRWFREPEPRFFYLDLRWWQAVGLGVALGVAVCLIV